MAAPKSDEKDQQSTVEAPAVKSDDGDGAKTGAKLDSKLDGKPNAKASAAAPRKSRGLLSTLLLSLIALAALLGAASYGVLTFRNADPTVGLAARYVDEGLAEAQGALDKAQSAIADLTGSPRPAGSRAPTRRAPLDKAPLAPLAPLAQTPPTPEPAAPESATEKTPEPGAPAPVEAAREPETPARPEAPREAAAEWPPAAAEPAKSVEIAKPAEPAKPAAPIVAVEPTDADGFTSRDLIAALEGRIEALSDEMKALRDKLDAPKNETRAAPEAEAPKTDAPNTAATPEPASVADAGAARLVVAVALQRDLDSGRPFADEIGALTRLGAEPARILVDLAEKGAPTGYRLREEFAAIAKQLKAHEQMAHEGADLTEHLLQGASKLVKVRPVGHAHPESLDGRIEKIEAALAQNDFAAAEAAFEGLPEEARNEAKAFGEALHQRFEVEKAADELLRGAIAALAAKK